MAPNDTVEGENTMNRPSLDSLRSDDWAGIVDVIWGGDGSAARAVAWYMAAGTVDDSGHHHPGRPFLDDGVTDRYVAESGRVSAAVAAVLVPALAGAYLVAHVIVAALRMVTP